MRNIPSTLVLPHETSNVRLKKLANKIIKGYATMHTINILANMFAFDDCPDHGPYEDGSCPKC
jgi:hypothetical protein